MKIDFDQKLLNIDGNVIPHTDEKNNTKDATLSIVARTALLARFQDENLNGDDHYHRWDLAKSAVGIAEWSVEDVSLLKRLIGKAYPPGIIGPAYDAIEPKTK